MPGFTVRLRSHITSFRAILLGFIILILTGAVLLSMPVSSAAHRQTPFIDALFTSASAACVTGLVVYDTAAYWSVFGKCVLFVLIQIGGLGVITVAIAAFIITGRQIGILQRSTMQDAISAPQIGGIVRLTKRILKWTIIAELSGAAVLATVFCRDMGFIPGLFSALFHSVSAFCNAGFDLMGSHGAFSSFEYYAGSTTVNLVLTALIISGGLGFLTWQDLLANGFRPGKLRLQTKIVLTTTAALIILPFLWFFFEEFGTLPLKQRTLTALFQTITPRTAGFSTVDYSTMSESSLLITIGLMITGGAPGSTAGGMKVTTLFVLIISARAFMRRKNDVNCFMRRLDPAVIYNAVTLLIIYLFLLLSGTVFLTETEQIPLLHAMFECASALGTVGLTCGVTPDLSEISRLVLSGYMFFGRVGGLTLAYAAVSGLKESCGKFPTEKIAVG